MANPSKRHQTRTSRLFLELFERRDLLSGTNFALGSLFSSTLSSGLLSSQSNDGSPDTDKSVAHPAAIEQEVLHFSALIDNFLAGMNLQTQATDSSSAVQGTTDLSAADSISSSLVSTTDPLSVTATPVSHHFKHPTLVNNVLTGNDALASTPIASDNDVQDQQSQTSTDNSGQGAQASSDAKTAVPVEVDSHLNDAANNGQRASGYSLPSDNSVDSLPSVTQGTPISLSPSVPTNGIAGGTVQSIGRVSVGDAAVRGSLRGTVADVRPAIVRDLYFSIVPDASRSRTESEATLSHPSATVSTVLLSKPRSVDGLTELDHLGLPSDRQLYLNRAFSGIDWNLPAPANARRDAPLELVASDEVFGQAARREANNSGAGDQGDEEEAEASPVNAPARGEGLLGSPLLFDLDSLAQEAQKFFAQIEQMGQDLAGLLGRTNLLSGLVAIGLAASAIEVARRRKQRAAHGIVLQTCAEPTFTSYPGLGGTWTWEEK
jgi:hypothetical protein